MKLQTLTSVLALTALVSAAGCEKSGGGKAPTASAKANPELDALAQFLPGGANLVIGGNYGQWQKLMEESPFFTLVKQQMEPVSPGMSTWMDCFSGSANVGALAAASLGADGIEIRVVMSGITVSTVHACAVKAGFPSVLDADGKYMSLEMKTQLGLTRSGYLVLPTGALYTLQRIPLSFAPSPVAIDRAALEADLARLGAGTLASDAALQAIMARADRTQAAWFAGSAAGTPVADKLGEVYGSISVADGIGISLTAQIKDTALARKVVDGLGQAKGMGEQMGGDVREIVQTLRYSQDGDRVQVSVRVTSAQITSLTKQFGAAMGTQ